MKIHLLAIEHYISNHILDVDKKTGNNWIENGIAIKYEKERIKKMKYFNQYDKKWANYPYPSKNHPTATIQTAGCGTTCAAMIVATLANKLVTPLVITKFSLENGFRGLEGTDETLFPAIAKKYDLQYAETINLDNAIKAIKDKKTVICLMNNWFKNGCGHYIVAYKMVGGLIGIKDPASTINTAKLFTKSLFKQKGSKYFIYSKKPARDLYVEAITELDKLNLADKKYWLPKRKIDKYFPKLMENIVKYIQGKEKK